MAAPLYLAKQLYQDEVDKYKPSQEVADERIKALVGLASLDAFLWISAFILASVGSAHVLPTPVAALYAVPILITLPWIGMAVVMVHQSNTSRRR